MGTDPMTWLGLGAAAAGTVGQQAWKVVMLALWSASLWVLELAFGIIDAFTTPDLSESGPLSKVLPYTFFLGASVAVLMALIQIGWAAWRRDGQSLARVLVGVVQFGLVWACYLTCAALLVTATAGLTKGLLSGLLGVDAFSGFDTATSWPRSVNDTAAATVLGLCGVFLIFPAAIGWLLIMFVREAALMLLTATSSISAGGLTGESTRVWWWKSLRWFIAALLISPLAALVLGVGVKILEGVIDGYGDDTTAAVGMVVTGGVLLLISSLCPMVLFRLLAFVDPGTSSGAAMRQSLAASGGIAGLLARGEDSGSGAAVRQDDQGRAQGEGEADAQTVGRFAGPLQHLTAKAATVASRATGIGIDVLALGGVGHQAPYYEQRADTGSAAPGGHGRGGVGPGQDDEPPASGPDGGEQPPPPLPPPVPPPVPPAPAGAGGRAAPPPGGGAVGGSAAATAETAAEAAVIAG
jgi:hypothetical protein